MSSVDQPRPTRRMSDMGTGPRRMDGSMAGRPVNRPQPGGQSQATRPAQPGMRPAGSAQRPMQRPVGAGQPMRQPQQPMTRQQQYAQQQRANQPQGRPAQVGSQGGRQQQYQQPQYDEPVAQQQVKPAKKQRETKRGGGWKVVAQFIIGLAVIIGVAAAIVTLYIKYYSTS